jgi:hypothetical protein
MNNIKDFEANEQKKEQMLRVLSEHLLLHTELPSVSEVCFRLSITTDEYARLLSLCSKEELSIVFSVLTPLVMMNVFQKTSETVAAQKLWCELFLEQKGVQSSSTTLPITVQFVDEKKEEHFQTAMESFEEIKQNNP